MALSGSLNTTGYDGRYLTLSWEVTNSQADRITNNKSVIKWTLKGAGKGGTNWYYTRNIKVTIDGTTVYNFPESSGKVTLYEGTVVASGTVTLSHKTDGSRTFSAYAEAGIYTYAVNCKGSATFTLDTIPRASSLTAGNGTLGTAQTLTINRAASSFKHRLTYTCGTVSGYIAGSSTAYTTSTSISWAPPVGLAAQNTTGLSVSVKLTLYTYASDGTHIGTATKTITCAIPPSVAPSCTLIIEDTAGIMARYGNPVQSLSNLRFSVTSQTSQGSPIAQTTVEAFGAKHTTLPAQTGTLMVVGSYTIKATVKDQRGRTGTSTQTVRVLAYTDPVLHGPTTHRCNADGTEYDQGEYISVTFSGSVATTIPGNSAAYSLRYRPSLSSSWTEVTFPDLAGVSVVEGHTYVFPADGNSSYDVEVTVTDNHNATTKATLVSTAFTILNLHPSGTGLAFGKVAERENAAEFGISIYDKSGHEVLGKETLLDLIYPVGAVYLSYSATAPGTLFGGTWEALPTALIRAATSSPGTTGAVADGTGRTFVNVYGWRRTA